MKAPAFWYRPRGLQAYALMPFSVLWRIGGMLQRAASTPYRSGIPAICIGNVVAGGAGKTPTAIAFAQMLITKGKSPVFVTRGYGGKEVGPLRVDPARHTALDVGDEALLLSRLAPVWIGRDRAAAMREAEKHGTHVILDDGLQNPSVRADMAFLVIDGTSAFGNGCIIPAGPLREPLEDAMKRITAIVLIGKDSTRNISSRARCPVLVARWEANLAADFPREQSFFAFAGIARPEKFYETCRQAGLTLVETQDFADHHVFTAHERAALQKHAQASNARLLTTEKDWVRLPADFQAQVTALPASLVFEDPEMLLGMINKTGKI